jgi:chromosomal replication initiator protein
MYLAKHETHISLANIGRLFGGKHHTTVLHALDRVEALRREDAATYRLIESVRRNLTLG